MIGMIRMNKSRRLFHKDDLMKVTVEECILDVKLSYEPSVGDCKRYDYANGLRFDHQTKLFIIVNAMLLFVSLGH